jgi:hypothetical protein
MPAKLNFFKTPASERLVSSRSVSTSTGISGCFQPGQAKVGLGPTPLIDTHTGFTVLWGTEPDPQGADSPPPLPLRVAKTGKNHLNEEITPLLSTGTGERFS